MSEINRYTHKLINRENLSSEDVARAMQIMTLGGATPAQCSAFFTALRMKGYTSDEIAGAINFCSLKQRLPDFKDQAVYISARPNKADSWICCGLILASLNIPTYIEFQRTEEVHVGQQLNLDLELDHDLAKECLEEAKLCIAYQRKTKVFRNVVSFYQELEFLNLFDIASHCASTVNPMAIVYEQQDNIDPKLMINAIHHTGCHTGVVIADNGNALRLMDNKLWEVLDLNTFIEPHKIGSSEKAARIRAFTHNAETLNQSDIIRKTAEVLLLVKAASSIDEGIRIATSVVQERQIDQILDKLVHISNSMEEDESVENEE